MGDATRGSPIPLHARIKAHTLCEEIAHLSYEEITHLAYARRPPRYYNQVNR
jgi:hypothetical protein